MGGDTTRDNQKMNITVTIHDFIARRQLRGVGGRI